MKLIWATRGRDWGFRFLWNAGFSDPLEEYDRLFKRAPDSSAVFVRQGEDVALRFLDPDGRTDRSGRAIPHEFILYPPLANQVQTVADGIEIVWPLVRDEFERIWERPSPSFD